MIVDAIIPALNEAPSIDTAVRAILRPPVRSVIVVDNGSSDETGALAHAAGACVVEEKRRGYGAACLAGVRILPADTDVVVFLDADGSDDPDDLPLLLAPIASGNADLVVGSRALGHAAPGSLTRTQRVGNALAAAWLRRRFGQAATDLGPFRAIRRTSLDALRMTDRDYGWMIEMHVRAAQCGLRYAEVPVAYRRRVGRSKISGTLRGVVGASVKILGLLAWYDLGRFVRR